MPLRKAHWLSGNQHLQIGADGDHARARRVAITVTNAAASTPIGTRTVPAGITISIMGAGTRGVRNGATVELGSGGVMPMSLTTLTIKATVSALENNPDQEPEEGEVAEECKVLTHPHRTLRA